MSNNLVKSDVYCIFTFAATAHALKAEKVLKDADAEFIIIPTLREISTSCGLSVKIDPAHLDMYHNTLKNNGVNIESVYHVEKHGKKNIVEKFEVAN